MKKFLIICCILVCSEGLVWSVPHVSSAANGTSQEEHFSALGIVSSITPSSLSIDNAHGSVNPEITSYSFDVSNVEKIESDTYVPLSLSDIAPGDTVIVQGTHSGDEIAIHRIISFGVHEIAPVTEEVATTTDMIATTTEEIATTTNIVATTTEDVATTTSAEATTTIEATTTDIIATSTEATTTIDATSTTEATSTPTFLETVSDTIGNIIDVIMGTSTPDVATTTDMTASVVESVIDSVGTSTPEEVITETPTLTPTTPEDPVPVATSSSE